MFLKAVNVFLTLNHVELQLLLSLTVQSSAVISGLIITIDNWFALYKVINSYPTCQVMLMSETLL